MSEAPETSTAARIAIAALAVFGYAGGWLILVLGGFHHAPNRYAKETIFVSGAPAMAMAIVFFAMAAVGVAALLQARKTAWVWPCVGCGAVLGPPLLFALVG